MMGYADGGDLKQLLDRRKKRRKPLTEDEVLHYFVQITLALKHMHDQHILHRDLKSQVRHLAGLVGALPLTPPTHCACSPVLCDCV